MIKKKVEELLNISEELILHLKLDLERWGNISTKEYKDSKHCLTLIKQLKSELKQVKTQSEVNYEKG